METVLSREETKGRDTRKMKKKFEEGKRKRNFQLMSSVSLKEAISSQAKEKE